MNMIKKWIVYITFFLGIIIKVIADDNSIESIVSLRHRFQHLDNFYAQFIQKINNYDGSLLEENKGELWIKRPNLFYWRIITPEESILISDGETLWFYVPAIKQAIAYWLRDVNDNIFFMLLDNDNTFIWNDYDVQEKKDGFFIRSMRKNNNFFKECNITITDDGIINRLSFIECYGQCVDYYLYNQSINKIETSKFRWDFPIDVQLDDRRK